MTDDSFCIDVQVLETDDKSSSGEGFNLFRSVGSRGDTNTFNEFVFTVECFVAATDQKRTPLPSKQAASASSEEANISQQVVPDRNHIALLVAETCSKVQQPTNAHPFSISTVQLSGLANRVFGAKLRIERFC